MKYGALKYNSTNIGDEIQSIASMRFLPQVDYFVFREQMNKFSSNNGEKVKMIMNAWYMWRPKNFPPSECVEPLLISMHFNPKCRTELLSKKSIDFLKKYGPVGCRDLSTKKWLENNGIPSYFSCCLTTTLIPNETLRKKYPQKYILCIDCSSALVEYIKKNSVYPVYSYNKFFSPYFESEDRMKLAKTILFTFQNASCVVTTNLHTAIPCLAFETNVCLIAKTKEESNAVGRFDGMDGFFNKSTEEDFLRGVYNFNNPPSNPSVFKQYRDLLVDKCRAFTGYDSNKPTLDDDFEPLFTLLPLLKENYNNIKRCLYWATKKDLLKMLLLKVFKRVDKNDICDDCYLSFHKRQNKASKNKK